MDVWEIQEPPPPTGCWHDLGKLGEAMLGPAGLWACGLVWGLSGQMRAMLRSRPRGPQFTTCINLQGCRRMPVSSPRQCLPQTATSCSVFKILASPPALC